MKHLRTGILVIVTIGLLWIVQMGSVLAVNTPLPKPVPFDSSGIDPSTSIVQDRDHSSAHWSHNCAQLSGPDAVYACNQALLLNPHDSATWTNRGQEFFKQGKYQEALTSNQYALLIKPDFSLALANQCGILAILGRYDEALSACDLAFMGDGVWGTQGECLAWNNRGEVLFHLGNYQEALNSFDRVLKQYPHNSMALQGRQLAQEAIDQDEFRPLEDWPSQIQQVTTMLTILHHPGR